VLSPDGTRHACIYGESQLVTVDREGVEQEVAQSEAITHFSWFPDSVHIAYSDRVQASDTMPLYEHQVWVVSTDSGSAYEVAPGLAPVVSPDGRHIAFLHGGAFGDACIVGFKLGIVRLDGDLRPTALYRQVEIQGIPASKQHHSFYPALAKDRAFPGRWRDNSTLEVAMRWACVDEAGQDGVYLIDLASRRAHRVAGYPRE
jgi:hypothetical protein